MIRLALILLALAAPLAGCHHATDTPAPGTNAAALEANLEQQANALEAQANAGADRNAADALANMPDLPDNAANAAQPYPVR